MSEKIHGLPKARVEKNYLTWSLWLIPLAALAVCAYFVLHDFVFAGPTITINFQNADGLQAQNSRVMFRGIRIGDIESLKLTKDQQGVAVRAKLDYSARNVARQGSVFWIVRPELKLGSVSGLRTIVSGDYVTVQPGAGPRTNTFVGAEQAPLPYIPSIYLTLLADSLGSLELQSPIFYRGIQVGEVAGFRLADNAQNVVVTARIREDYAPLVRMDSEFWNAGGIHIHAGLFSGIEISAESAETVVSGGIAFATPPNYGPAATNGAVFPLNNEEQSVWKSWNPAIRLQNVPPGKASKNTLPQFAPAQ
jgi:paraquat-inducible protein B